MKNQNIMQYESTVWNTANFLYASGIKLSDALKFMQQLAGTVSEIRVDVAHKITGDEVPTVIFLEALNSIFRACPKSE
jgi:hypothetical protein